MSEKFKFEGEMTYGQMYNDLLPNIQQEDVAEYLEACIQYTMRVGNMDHTEAENVVRVNIGYIAGYFSTETAQRIHNMFKVAHPFLGSADNWDSMTAETIVEKGVQLADELAPTVQPADEAARGADWVPSDELGSLDYAVAMLESEFMKNGRYSAVKHHFKSIDEWHRDALETEADLRAKLASAEAALAVAQRERDATLKALDNVIVHIASADEVPDSVYNFARREQQHAAKALQASEKAE